METMKDDLENKRAPWKRSISNALDTAYNKLTDYYSKTDDVNRLVYNIGVCLNPFKKLSIYEGDDWAVTKADDAPGNQTWKEIYKAQLHQYYNKYYAPASRFS